MNFKVNSDWFKLCSEKVLDLVEMKEKDSIRSPRSNKKVVGRNIYEITFMGNKLYNFINCNWKHTLTYFKPTTDSTLNVAPLRQKIRKEPVKMFVSRARKMWRRWKLCPDPETTVCQDQNKISEDLNRTLGDPKLI